MAGRSGTVMSSVLPYLSMADISRLAQTCSAIRASLAAHSNQVASSIASELGTRVSQQVGNGSHGLARLWQRTSMLIQCGGLLASAVEVPETHPDGGGENTAAVPVYDRDIREGSSSSPHGWKYMRADVVRGHEDTGKSCGTHASPVGQSPTHARGRNSRLRGSAASQPLLGSAKKFHSSVGVQGVMSSTKGKPSIYGAINATEKASCQGVPLPTNTADGQGHGTSVDLIHELRQLCMQHGVAVPSRLQAMARDPAAGGLARAIVEWEAAGMVLGGEDPREFEGWLEESAATALLLMGVAGALVHLPGRMDAIRNVFKNTHETRRRLTREEHPWHRTTRINASQDDLHLEHASATNSSRVLIPHPGGVLVDPDVMELDAVQGLFHVSQDSEDDGNEASHQDRFRRIVVGAMKDFRQEGPDLEWRIERLGLNTRTDSLGLNTQGNLGLHFDWLTSSGAISGHHKVSGCIRMQVLATPGVFPGRRQEIQQLYTQSDTILGGTSHQNDLAVQSSRSKCSRPSRRQWAMPAPSPLDAARWHQIAALEGRDIDMVSELVYKLPHQCDIAANNLSLIDHYWCYCKSCSCCRIFCSSYPWRLVLMLLVDCCHVTVPLVFFLVFAMSFVAQAVPMACTRMELAAYNETVLSVPPSQTNVPMDVLDDITSHCWSGKMLGWGGHNSTAANVVSTVQDFSLDPWLQWTMLFPAWVAAMCVCCVIVCLQPCMCHTSDGSMYPPIVLLLWSTWDLKTPTDRDIVGADGQRQVRIRDFVQISSWTAKVSFNEAAFFRSSRIAGRPINYLPISISNAQMMLYDPVMAGLSGILAPPILSVLSVLAVASTYTMLGIDLLVQERARDACQYAGISVLTALVVPLVLNILRLQWRNGGRHGWWPTLHTIKLGCLWLSWSFFDCFGLGVLLVIWSDGGSHAAGIALWVFACMRLLLMFCHSGLVYGCLDNQSHGARMVMENAFDVPFWDVLFEAPKYAVLATICTVIAMHASPVAIITSPVSLGAWVMATYMVAAGASIIQLCLCCGLPIGIAFNRSILQTGGSYAGELKGIRLANQTISAMRQRVASHQVQTRFLGCCLLHGSMYENDGCYRGTCCQCSDDPGYSNPTAAVAQRWYSPEFSATFNRIRRDSSMRLPTSDASDCCPRWVSLCCGDKSIRDYEDDLQQRMASWPPACHFGLTLPNPNGKQSRRFNPKRGAEAGLAAASMASKYLIRRAVLALRSAHGSAEGTGAAMLQLHLRLERLQASIRQALSSDRRPHTISRSYHSHRQGNTPRIDPSSFAMTGLNLPQLHMQVRAASGAAITAAMLLLGGPKSLMGEFVSVQRQHSQHGQSHSRANRKGRGRSLAGGSSAARGYGDSVDAWTVSDQSSANAAGSAAMHNAEDGGSDRDRLSHALERGRSAWRRMVSRSMPEGGAPSWTTADASMLVEMGGGEAVYRVQAGGNLARSQGGIRGKGASLPAGGKGGMGDSDLSD